MIYSETTTSLSAGDITTTTPTNIRSVESVTDGDDLTVATMTNSGETTRKMLQMIFNSMFNVVREAGAGYPRNERRPRPVSPF